MIRRHERSDAEWQLVQPLLLRSVLGRPRLDDRTIPNGIEWKFRTGVAWRDVTDRYGSGASLHTRFRRWAADGTCERMLQAAQARADAVGDIEWLVSVDSTARADQHAGGAREGAPQPGPRPVPRRTDQQDSPGLRRDGPSPHVRLTGGNTNDCTQFTAAMDAVRAPRIGPGRTCVWPDHVIGDKGYSSKAIRTWLRRRSVTHTIPERSDEVPNRTRRGSRGGRPPAFGKQVYMDRNVLERCSAGLLRSW
ncbi:IS5 family transposase [Streptomyces xanthophaeus]|uniref:IS5 family transposase n=1 Tax=Streptomyces xanthophaeus TaxID=67385 RepID=UPI00386C2F60